MFHRYLFVSAVAFTLTPAAVAAQGAFGSALAISGREVYVGQPGNSYAPGMVYVFRQDAAPAFADLRGAGVPDRFAGGAGGGIVYFRANHSK